MTPIYKISTYILIVLALSSCVSEIPNPSNFEPQVFISGFLTNGTEYVTIRIQQTVPVDEQNLDPINDAQISLYTEGNNGDDVLITSAFTISNGTYRSAERVASTIGRVYWIEVLLADGTRFVSDKEILKPAVIINDIEITREFNRVIFVDPGDDTNFYLINFDFVKNGESVLTISELTSDVLFNGNDEASFSSSEFRTDPAGKEVRVSISNLNFNTYQFYLNQFEQFENQITNAGSENDPGQLFLPPPAHLTGNIMNTTANTKALGFFGVQSTAQFVKNF